ncbi:hypothetical protein LSTR_LSTR015135 [Laodelphax striatellus]|uniref:Uncharacterized protein n=1 Tax=Laodelphax striatellus TaxID=195883 RepID=A0A482WMB0_LAOST|nr:hypothetical protein LSTR_LSTR015135 [Laodelphax striatellus]
MKTRKRKEIASQRWAPGDTRQPANRSPRRAANLFLTTAEKSTDASRLIGDNIIAVLPANTNENKSVRRH